MVHAISQDHGHDIDMHGYLSGSGAEEPSDTRLSLVEKADPDALPKRDGAQAEETAATPGSSAQAASSGEGS